MTGPPVDASISPLNYAATILSWRDKVFLYGYVYPLFDEVRLIIQDLGLEASS